MIGKLVYAGRGQVADAFNGNLVSMRQLVDEWNAVIYSWYEIREISGKIHRYARKNQSWPCGDDLELFASALDRVLDRRKAPSRNCDIGTADEIRSRLRDYCRSHLCGKCPFDKETDEIDDNHSCVIRWLLSPAKEGGAT